MLANKAQLHNDKSLREKVIANTLTVICILLACFIFSQNLGDSPYLHYDEYYTLERSGSFSKYDTFFTIYSKGEPSSNKPPLQYWLTALNFEIDLPELLALRLWSFVFYIGLLLATVFICKNLIPDNPWAGLSGVLFLASSAQMLQLGRMGLLDIGIAFLFMAALMFATLPSNQRYKWIACGVFLGLGALQKAPTIILFAFILFILHKRKLPGWTWKELRKKPGFNIGMYLAISLTLLWPVIQSVRHGIDFIASAYNSQIVKRLNPLREFEGNENNVGHLFEWLWDDWQLVAPISFICLGAVFIVKRFRSHPIIFGIACYLTFLIIILTFAKGSIYPRYLSLVTPFLAVISIFVFSNIIKWKPAVLLIAASAFLLNSASVINQTNPLLSRDIAPPYYNYNTLAEVVPQIEQLTSSSQRLLIDTNAIPPGAMGFFSKNLDTYQFYKSTNANNFASMIDLIRSKHSTNQTSFEYVGVTSEESMQNLILNLPNVKIVHKFDGIIVWSHEEKNN